MTGRKEPRRPRIKQTWVRTPVEGEQAAPRNLKGHARQRERDAWAAEAWRAGPAKRAGRRLRVAALLSDEGREFSGLLSYLDRREIQGHVVAVISDNPDAAGVVLASDRGIRTVIVE